MSRRDQIELREINILYRHLYVLWKRFLIINQKVNKEVKKVILTSPLSLFKHYLLNKDYKT